MAVDCRPREGDGTGRQTSEVRTILRLHTSNSYFCYESRGDRMSVMNKRVRGKEGSGRNQKVSFSFF